MKNLRLIMAILFVGLIFTASGYSRTVAAKCDAYGRINGMFYTSCYAWESGDGTLTVGGTTVNNDTARLRYLLENSSTIGKIVFDEAGYYINDSIVLYSYRTVIGTGRAPINTPSTGGYLTSRIVQTANNTPIFTIGGGINSVAVRDIALVAGPGTSGTIGIRAQNGNDDAGSLLSYNFEFTNITFDGLDKGIFVNAKSYTTVYPPEQGYGQEGFWRFDNVKLDHSQFHYCRIAVHINSSNSGWTAKNIMIDLPNGAQIPSDVGITSSNVGSMSLGFYLQRVAYSTFGSAIAGGPGSGSASALFYVGQHANLTLENNIDEGFKNSVYIFGGDTNNPINLSNNYFQSPVRVRFSHVVSTSNQFNFPPSPSVAPAEAVLGSKIFSVGDKFCFEVSSTLCSDVTYQTDYTSQVIFSANQNRTSMNALRIGTYPYQYDIARNIYDGILEFKGEQGSGYAGYSFATQGGTVKINYDGSVTYGSKTYSNLTAFTGLLVPSPNGTVIYCSDCQKSTPCGSGGSGALAKRINGTWDCN